MAQKYYPSVARIMATFKVDKTQAKLAREIMDGTFFPMSNNYQKMESLCFYQTCKWIKSCYHNPSMHEIKMNLLDELLKSYGIEFINLEPENYFHPNGIEYLNMGDTYTDTLIYFNGRYSIGCWGDYLEYWENKHGQLA